MGGLMAFVFEATNEGFSVRQEAFKVTVGERGFATGINLVVSKRLYLAEKILTHTLIVSYASIEDCIVEELKNLKRQVENAIEVESKKKG